MKLNMFEPKCVLLFGFLLTLLLDPISGLKRRHRVRWAFKFPSFTSSSPANTRSQEYFQYNPPSEIIYPPHGSGISKSYPVYHGAEPSNIYEYIKSEGKYGRLLAGLALYNLGTSSDSNYVPQSGEVCKFGIETTKDNYEEMTIDCNIISNLLQNMTEVDGRTALPPDPKFLVSDKVNVTGVLLPPVFVNATHDTTASGTQVTLADSILSDALDVERTPEDVTPDYKECYVTRTISSNTIRKNMPCGLLQTYADESISVVNSAVRNGPIFTFFLVFIAVCVAF